MSIGVEGFVDTFLQSLLAGVPLLPGTANSAHTCYHDWSPPPFPAPHLHLKILCPHIPPYSSNSLTAPHLPKFQGVLRNSA
ncbi:hypothetical protein E2C01_101254 [Portunus trituberculatus]|uniref:Uncharacterized protein n=1 Tax=Portunus trituberculatus TaxID=210409 RepID=A0A5B7KFM5_PORTR|nr:hypothetical protein [Portunus trituberculatus]